MEDEEGNIILPKIGDKAFFGIVKKISCDYQNGKINQLKHVPRTENALFAKFPAIINTGSIDHYCWSYPRNFNGFLNRICRCSGNFRYNGGFLTCQCIDQGTLAVVPPAKNSDMWFSIASQIGRAHV